VRLVDIRYTCEAHPSPASSTHYQSSSVLPIACLLLYSLKTDHSTPPSAISRRKDSTAMLWRSTRLKAQLGSAGCASFLDHCRKRSDWRLSKGFLSSWLLVEFLVLIAARTARDAPPNWPSDAFEVIDAIAFFSVLASTTFVESIMLLIQLELHIFAALADLSFTHPWVLTLLICLFFFFTIGVYSALLSLLSALAHRGFSEHLGLAETFLVAFRERDGESLKVDRVAIWCLGCFVIHLAACFMLYGYSGMYNPSGTVNPGWTGVFG
jgi:hypothetical protein